MANIKSAIKDIRKSKKNHARNLLVKNNVKKLIKSAQKAIIEKSKDAKEAVKKAISTIDKAVANGKMHRNTAARKKSRLVAKLNAVSK
jgi:small subunit ribosomal protein S20